MSNATISGAAHVTVLSARSVRSGHVTAPWLIRVLTLGLAVVALTASVGAASARADTFNSFNPIDVTDATGAVPPFVAGSAVPYPSQITVSGLPGVVSGVHVTLHGVAHTRPDDLDILLAGPGGQSVVVLSDSGETFPLTGSEIAFDDAGPAAPDTTALGPGPYHPTNNFGGLGEPLDDVFPAPAPAALRAASFAEAFNGTAPNGTWSLYALDDRPGATGSLQEGWSLDLTTAPAPVTPPPPPAPDPGPGLQPLAPAGGLGAAPPHAQFSLSAPTVPRGRPITLDASASIASGAAAQRFAWDLNGDGRTDASCDGTTPILKTRLPSAGSSAVHLTVTDATGVTSSALQPLTITASRIGTGPVGRVPAGPRGAGLTVPFGLHYSCLAGHVRLDTDITAQGGPPAGCIGQLAFGIVDAVGCLDPAPKVDDIPVAERNVIIPILQPVGAADTEIAGTAGAASTSSFAQDFRKVQEEFADREPVISRQAVRINGVDITPHGDAVVAIIPSSYQHFTRVATKGYIVSSNATITVGNVPLQSGQIRVELPFGTRRAHVFDFNLRRNLPFLKGLPLTGAISGDLVDQATELPAHVMLPGVFTDPSTGKALSADVTLRTSNSEGVQLDGLEVHAPHVFLGGIALDDLFFRYRRADETYEGGGRVLFPPNGDAIGGSIGFQGGNFKHLDLSYDAGPDSTGISVGPGVSLLHVGGAFRLNPTELDANAVLGMGVAADRGCPLVGVRAALNQHFSPPPYVLDAEGDVELDCIPLSHGFLHVDGDGYVAFGGALDYDFLVFSLHAQVTAQYLDGNFQADGNARGCLGDLGCLGGEAVISNAGMGFCAVIGNDFVGHVHVGAGFFYPPIETLANPVSAIAGILARTSIMWDSCNVGQFRTIPEKRSRQAGPAPAGTRAFDVTDPSDALVVGVTGVGAVAQVKLTGPDGRVVQAPADAALRSAGAVVFHSPADETEYFLIDKPAKGTWTLQPLADSPPVADVRVGHSVPDPGITGTLRRHGATYELHYTWAKTPGQSVRFVEQAPGGERILGTATGTAGTLRFSPSDANGNARKIVAQVQLDRHPQANVDVASYNAPPTRLGRPTGVVVRRRGRSVTVSWKAVPGAPGYLVSAHVNDGRSLIVPVRGRRHAASITPVSRRATVVVHVSTLRRGGVPGPHSPDVRLKARR